MRLVDAWRLTGPNLQTRRPAALAEVAFDAGDEPDEPEDRARALGIWRREVVRLASAVGLPIVDPAARVFRRGAVLTFVAPIDLLLPAIDLIEWSVERAAVLARGESGDAVVDRSAEIVAAIAGHRNPWLVTIEAAARARGIPMSWDDETLSLGSGPHGRAWSMAELPSVDAIAWDALGSIPVVLISGTNGKTTSTRLVARIARCAGLRVGSTSTDGVVVNDAIVEHGDYTGPAGARLVLRRTDVDVAILETARGGILRRGLAVDAADGALITNASDDHLGDYGIDDVPTMARVKSVVGTVVGAHGRVVLNADDPHLEALASTFSATVVPFSRTASNPWIESWRARGSEVWTVSDGHITVFREGSRRAIIAVDDVPIAFGGAAPFNVENALGAAAVARSFGADDAAIAAGLRSFTPTEADNPGRGNVRDVDGTTVMIDFAHNPKAVAGVLALVATMRRPDARLIVLAGHAGDRSDENVRDVARAIHAARPAIVIVRDLDGYLRGRAPGEVPALFRDELLRLGMSEGSVVVEESERAALRHALALANRGDFVLILAHVEDLSSVLGAPPA